MIQELHRFLNVNRPRDLGLSPRYTGPVTLPCLAFLIVLVATAILIPGNTWAAMETWQGSMVVSPSSNTEEGHIDPEEICGFTTLSFVADVGDRKYDFVVTHNDRKSKFNDGIRNDGRIAEWGTLRIGTQQVEVKLEGQFSDTAFVGRLYGSYRSLDFRASGEWNCRADVFMARAPLTVESIQETHERLGDSANGADVLAAVSNTVQAPAKPEPAPQIDKPAATMSASQTPRSTTPAAAAPQATVSHQAIAPAPAPAAAPAFSSDLGSQLALLKELNNGGLIDDAEFDRRRKALLDGAFGATVNQQQATASPNQQFSPPLPSSNGDIMANRAPQAAGGSSSAGRPDLAPSIDWGNYHALVIGINDYQNLPKLETAINDALRVADMLERLYGFQVQKLINPTRQQIIDAFDQLRETLRGDDNLLIYYAGHGWLDEEADRGYWLAVDAQPNRRGNWVSNATITDTLKTLLAKHVMIVADSCFSGSLTRAAPVTLRNANFWEKIANKAARVTLTSGGLEPVADNNGSGHSPFAAAFIDALESNESVLDGTGLFSAMRRPVMLNANQTPEYSDVRSAGHDGGDFVFVRKN